MHLPFDMCAVKNKMLVSVIILDNLSHFDSFYLSLTCKKHDDDATNMGLCSLWDISLMLCVLKIKYMTVKIKQ